MPSIQTATTGQLEDAQGIIIAQCRFTAEHEAPMKALVEALTLPQGDKSMTVPKVGQMIAKNLTDGVDMTEVQDIGMTTVSLTTGEVGLKVILTDKLLRQQSEDVFKMVGRQMGNASARKVNRDLIALFSALNSGTVLGLDGKNMSTANVSGAIAWAVSNKIAKPMAIIHHPNACAYLAQSLIPIGTTYIGGMTGYSESILRDFFKVNINGVPVFQTGDIDKITGYDSGYGAIFGKSAMCIIESKGWSEERERDASLRAWEVNLTADYGVFELDDTQGAALQWEIGTLNTAA